MGNCQTLSHHEINQKSVDIRLVVEFPNYTYKSKMANLNQQSNQTSLIALAECYPTTTNKLKIKLMEYQPIGIYKNKNKRSLAPLVNHYPASAIRAMEGA